jgi:hypothetical protein
MRILSTIMLLFGVAALFFSWTALMVESLILFVPFCTAGVFLLLGAGWVWHKASWLDLSVRNPDAAKTQSRAQLWKGRLRHMALFLSIGIAVALVFVRVILGP